MELFPVENSTLWQIAFRLHSEDPLSDLPPLSVQNELMKLADAVLRNHLPIVWPHDEGEKQSVFTALKQAQAGSSFDKKILSMISIDSGDFWHYKSLFTQDMKKYGIRFLDDTLALEWARKPCWSKGEAVLLLVGLVPEAINTQDFFTFDADIFGKAIPEAIDRAVAAGNLIAVGLGQNGMPVFKPSDVVRVAKAANVGMWEYWEGALLEAETGMRVLDAAGVEMIGMTELVWNDGKKIDWEYWLEKMPNLTRAQASRLMSGLDPEAFKDLDISPNKNDTSEQRRRARQIEILAEAEGKEKDESLGWLLWGERKELPVTATFCLNVRKHKYSVQEKNKKAEGRYTLKEAAELLEKEGDARDGQMLAKLMKAVESGELKAYWPGCKDTYSGKQTRSDYEEVYWSDLNAWLEKHEPRITFRFPAPNGSASPGIGEASKSPSTIPGKMPKVDIRIQAVEAAWKIQCDNGKAATAKEVMELLYCWADKHKGSLLRSDKVKKCVFWLTSKSEEKAFDLSACEKALSSWRKSIP